MVQQKNIRSAFWQSQNRSNQNAGYLGHQFLEPQGIWTNLSTTCSGCRCESLGSTSCPMLRLNLNYQIKTLHVIWLEEDTVIIAIMRSLHTWNRCTVPSSQASPGMTIDSAASTNSSVLLWTFLNFKGSWDPGDPAKIDTKLKPLDCFMFLLYIDYGYFWFIDSQSQVAKTSTEDSALAETLHIMQSEISEALGILRSHW